MSTAMGMLDVNTVTQERRHRTPQILESSHLLYQMRIQHEKSQAQMGAPMATPTAKIKGRERKIPTVTMVLRMALLDFNPADAFQHHSLAKEKAMRAWGLFRVGHRFREFIPDEEKGDEGHDDGAGEEEGEDHEREDHARAEAGGGAQLVLGPRLGDEGSGPRGQGQP